MVKIRRFTVMTGLSIIVATLPLTNLSLLATSPSLWMGTQDPIYTSIGPSSFSDPYTAPTNEPCLKKTITVMQRPSQLSPFSPSERQECGVRTRFGLVTKSGFMQFAYDSVAYPLQVDSSHAFASPNTMSLLAVSSSSGFLNLSVYDNPAAQFVRQADSTYQYKYVPQTSPSRILKNTDGQLIGFRTMTTSDNGEWLLIQNTGNSLTRINLKTLEMLTFNGEIPAYGIGRDPTAHLAISNDGRYVAMSGFNVRAVKVFDLSTCSPQSQTNYLTQTTGCGRRDLTDFLLRYLNVGEIAGFGLRFSDDSTDLTMSLGSIFGLVALTAPGINNEQLDYLALGDSYSSGEGDTENGGNNYIAGTDGDAAPEAGIDVAKEKCHIHPRSYPYLLAQSMNIPAGKFRSVACSSAKINDIINTSDDPNEGYIGQFEQIHLKDKESIGDVKNKALSTFAPGRSAQITFVKKYRPKIATIGIGGNDVGFGSKIEACAGLGICDYVTNDSLKGFIGAEIQSLYRKLRNLYSDLHQASSQTKFYAVGYPQFVKIEGACGLNVRFSNNERQLINESISYLNNVIRSAANAEGFRYIDIQSSLGEAALCGSAGHLGVTGLAMGEDNLVKINILGTPIYIGFAQESYHPNPLGHSLIANYIIATHTNLLTDAACGAIPCPNSEWSMPNLPTYFTPTSAPFVVQMLPITNQPVNSSTAESNININIDQLKPNSTVNFELHSTKISLGSLIANANGSINGTLHLPPNLPVGPHTLHAYAITPSGEQSDIYQPIFITGENGDIDNDGILDPQDPCLFAPASGIDYDRDGQDDACDGYISDPPADTTPPTVIGTPDRQPNNLGWYNNDVTINWSSADPEPSSGTPTTPAATLASLEGENVYTSDSSCDPLNNCSTGSLNLRLDKTPPTIVNFVSPVPNDAGWNNTDVTVTPNCLDQLAGIAECDSPTVLNTDGMNQVVTTNAIDKAGNTAWAASVVHIDKTAPTLDTPTWANNPKSTDSVATLQINAHDNLSGIEEAEYYLGDIDPGQGNGATVTIDNGKLSTNFGTDFPTGVYKVTVRAKDQAGNWSSEISDYLVVYNPTGTRMTGKKTVVPSLTNGDILPGLIDNNQTEKAQFGFNVRYDDQGTIHPHSDFQFKYKTTSNMFELNSTSIAWIVSQGINNSTGIFQGVATLRINGVTSNVIFRLTGLDGERLSPSSSDHLTLKVYKSTDNPNTAPPIYQVNGDVVRGNIKIQV